MRRKRLIDEIRCNGEKNKGNAEPLSPKRKQFAKHKSSSDQRNGQAKRKHSAKHSGTKLVNRIAVEKRAESHHAHLEHVERDGEMTPREMEHVPIFAESKREKRRDDWLKHKRENNCQATIVSCINDFLLQHVAETEECRAERLQRNSDRIVKRKREKRLA